MAEVAINNVKRGTSPEFDKGEFGFRDKFKSLEAEIKKKVRPGAPAPKPAPREKDKDKKDP